MSLGRSGIRPPQPPALPRPGSDEKRPNPCQVLGFSHEESSRPHPILPISGENSPWPRSVAKTLPPPSPGAHLQLGPPRQVGLDAVTVAGARAGIDYAIHDPAGVHHVHHKHAHHQAGERAAAAPHGAAAPGAERGAHQLRSVSLPRAPRASWPEPHWTLRPPPLTGEPLHAAAAAGELTRRAPLAAGRPA